MKKMVRYALLFATMVGILPACVRVQEEFPAGNTVQFTAGVPLTRTAFSAPEGDSYPVVWTANDSRVKIALNMTQVRDAAVTPAADGKSATFAASFGDAQAPYDFYLMSPASAYDKAVGSELYFRVPAAQTPTAQSVDEAAQILIAASKGYAEMPARVAFTLGHWTAYGLLTFENLALGEAKISAVELTAEKPLAGSWTMDVTTGTSAAGEGVNTITLTTASASGVWFACAPADLAGTKLTVKVVTDKGNCTKEINLPAGSKLIAGKVARIKIDMAGITPHTPALKIERVWGKFSTADASWNEYYGGTAGQDRNVAMDDEYIYLPETTRAAKLWRMSYDGKNVSAANVEGVTGGTFAIGCVRMIPNKSVQVNGGKDFLMGVSMTQADNAEPVYIYSYDQGTDKAPKRTSASTGWGRRLGDKFTFFGSLQDGGLFLKDYNNVKDGDGDGGAFLVLRTAWSVAPVDGYFNPRRTNLYNDDGVGAYYPYPEDVQHGIYTSTVSSRYVSLAKSPLVENPNKTMTSTDAGGWYKNAHGFNFFTFNGKRYVAYAKNVESNDGRFYILEGAAGDSWEDIIKAHEVIYQASLQRDIAFHDKDYHTELEVPSPRASGNWGLDVTVREVGGVVYLAADMQNVGLSLFRMAFE